MSANKKRLWRLCCSSYPTLQRRTPFSPSPLSLVSICLFKLLPIFCKINQMEIHCCLEMRRFSHFNHISSTELYSQISFDWPRSSPSRARFPSRWYPTRPYPALPTYPALHSVKNESALLVVSFSTRRAPDASSPSPACA